MLVSLVNCYPNKRSGFLTTVRATLGGLEKLNLQSEPLKPGEADLSFLIPRELFKNQLGTFAKELTFISKLMTHISESVGDQRPIALAGLSSSIPTISVEAGLVTIGIFATVVNKFLDAWDKISKIRKIRGELKDMGISGPPVEHLDEQITTTVQEVVEESVSIVLVNYQGEPGRKNELANALTQDTHRLFGQIEMGLTVEFKAADKPDASEEEKVALTNVGQMATVKFPGVSNDPLLLENGLVIEGDLQFVHKTKKTTTTKATTKKDSDGKSTSH